MEIIFALVMWVVLSVLVGKYANSKGKDGASWTLLSLVISPLIAFVIAAASPVNSSGLVAAGGHKKCPQCAETVLAEAKICRFCHSKFEDAVAEQLPIQAEASAMPEPQDSFSVSNKALALWVIVPLAIGILALALVASR
jgi:hypothetical protein